MQSVLAMRLPDAITRCGFLEGEPFVLLMFWYVQRALASTHIGYSAVVPPVVLLYPRNNRLTVSINITETNHAPR